MDHIGVTKKINPPDPITFWFYPSGFLENPGDVSIPPLPPLLFGVLPRSKVLRSSIRSRVFTWPFGWLTLCPLDLLMFFFWEMEMMLLDIFLAKRPGVNYDIYNDLSLGHFNNALQLQEWDEHVPDQWGRLLDFLAFFLKLCFFFFPGKKQTWCVAKVFFWGVSEIGGEGLFFCKD